MGLSSPYTAIPKYNLRRGPICWGRIPQASIQPYSPPEPHYRQQLFLEPEIQKRIRNVSNCACFGIVLSLFQPARFSC